MTPADLLPLVYGGCQANMYGIALPLAPFVYVGPATRTEVRLDRIRFDVGAWREVVGRVFRFPIDGSAEGQNS